MFIFPQSAIIPHLTVTESDSLRADPAPKDLGLEAGQVGHDPALLVVPAAVIGTYLSSRERFM